jgi:hypothetical protein
MKINNFAGIPKGHKSPLLRMDQFGFFEIPMSDARLLHGRRTSRTLTVAYVFRLNKNKGKHE